MGLKFIYAYNPLSFNPMKIGAYSSKNSVWPLKEGGDALNC